MSDVNLSISQEVVRPIIEAKIHAAILAQLSDSASIMQDIVTRVLQSKVDAEGKPERYSGGIELIKWLCEKGIREATVSAVQEAVDKMKPELTKLVVADLGKRKGQIAKMLVDTFASQAKASWMIRAELTLEERK